MVRACSLTLLAAAVLADVTLVTFDGAAGTTFKFDELNDPVMGGKSTGTWSVNTTLGAGIFQGEVVDVPKLSAPGFIKAAADGAFADASSAIDGDLILWVRTFTPSFSGFKVTVVSGSLSPSYACAGGGSLPLSRGCFKANFSVPTGFDFVPVRIPFASFSDMWSPATGQHTKECADDKDVCLTADKLKGIKRIEVWGEGALGKLQLEVMKITAGTKSGTKVLKSGSMPCPGSSASIHASCEQTATFATSCAAVATEIKARVAGQPSAWHDPHNNGTYTLISGTDSTMLLSRTTGNLKYTDKMTLTLSGDASSCTLQGCSESQVTSFSDYSTNYCNVRMLYCGTADGCKPAKNDLVSSVTSTDPSMGASTKMADCLKL